MINRKQFIALVASLGCVFFVVFLLVVLPPLFENPDIIAAFLAGFVNPYAAGYSSDVIICWFLLAVWIVYELKRFRFGWACLLLGIIPGVAVGFAAYLIIRETDWGKRR